jgi:rhodanese-related sulfurtransferase
VGRQTRSPPQRSRSPPSELPEISARDLAQSLRSAEPPQLAEILGPAYFASGHLPGAVNLPLEGLAETAARVLPDKQADIVVYCASDSCKNSDIARRKLLDLG